MHDHVAGIITVQSITCTWCAILFSEDCAVLAAGDRDRRLAVAE